MQAWACARGAGAPLAALKDHRREPSRLLPPPGLPRVGSGAASPFLPQTLRQQRRRQFGALPCAVQASLLPDKLLGAAARAASAVPDLAGGAAGGAGAAGFLAGAIDPGVLGATVAASGKLCMICAAVGWLLRSGRIPNSTATVMSQVSFQLLIPAMLFSKVAATLATNPDTTLLLGIAAVALFQICVGAASGLLLSPLLGLKVGGGGTKDGGGNSGAWQGRSSPEATAAIATSLAAAAGAPQAAAALRPRQPEPAGGGPAQMVAASAAFGNSFTLPAVFLTTLLPAPLANRALGYAALFLLAWSPCLWSIGLALGGGGKQQPAAAPPSPAQQQQQQQAGPVQRVAVHAGVGSSGGAGGEAQEQVDGAAEYNRAVKPLAWRQPRIVDVTPSAATDSYGNGSGNGSLSVDGSGAAVLEPPFWVDQMVRHPVTAKLGRFASQVLNPPVVAILVGTLVGLTPAGRALLVATQSSGAAVAGAGAAAALPPELGLLHATVKAALEVIELLAAGTLATQTLVLAASLLQQSESKASAAAKAVGPASAATAAAATSLHRRGVLGALRQLLPSDSTEARALGVLILTRFVAVPLATIALLQGLAAGGLLPPVLSDPILLFVLLVEAVMPSAQNLIIVLQLSERTQGMAPSFARMLLKLYFLAILPVTLWVTAFATNLQIPVLR